MSDDRCPACGKDRLPERRRPDDVVTQPNDLPCPECDGTGSVWADFHGAEVEAECPYCGGSGRALRRALIRDGYPTSEETP